MPVPVAGMQIPDHTVKLFRTKSASFPSSRKSLQGALQLVLRPLIRAGIKFGPRFAPARSGMMLRPRGGEASKREFLDACENFANDFDYLTASARQFHLGET